jgi:phosphatidylserine decarboxylase
MITREGVPFITGLLIATVLLRIWGHIIDSTLILNSAIIPGLLFLFCLNFFRDPKRETPDESGIFVSPADGKIVQINSINDPDIGETTLISIFLNVFNVHVNRIPFSGTIEKVEYKKGKFLAAFNHSASDENEQSIVHIQSRTGLIKIKQIAGLLARRIKCYAEPGNQVERGDKFGFIMFGSRVDLMLSKDIHISGKLGQKVKGGETIIGKINEKKT